MKDECKNELERTQHPELGALRELGRDLDVAQEMLAAVWGPLSAGNAQHWPSAEEAYAEGMFYLIEALRSFLGGYEESLRRLEEWRLREPPETPPGDETPSAQEIPF